MISQGNPSCNFTALPEEPKCLDSNAASGFLTSISLAPAPLPWYGSCSLSMYASVLKTLPTSTRLARTQRILCYNIAVLLLQGPYEHLIRQKAKKRSTETFQCMCACSVVQSCPAPSESMDCSLRGSSVRGIPQVRILEWVAMPSSRGSSQPRD